MLIKRLDKVDKTSRYYKCPVCGHGEVRVDGAVFYGRCNECNATLIDFTPSAHQENFFTSTAVYKMLIGGFASGKTSIGCLADVEHCIRVPNARILITGPSLQQISEAVLPELNRMIPPWYLVGGRAKGKPPVYNFINGSKIIIYASDDETKIRSLNLTGFHIVEASGVDFSIFETLQTRLRNSAAVIFDEKGLEVGWDYMGIIETNPEEGWVRDEFMLRAETINGSQTVDTGLYENIRVSPENRVKEYEVFISTSFDNPYLPVGTIERISAGRNERWKRKYLYSILDSKEGLVYPDIPKYFEEPFDIPRTWKRIAGFDAGISHPTAMLIGAVDPNTNIIHFYDEYYKTDQAIRYHGDQLNPKIKPYTWLFPIQADPAVRQRSKETGRSYRNYFKQITGINLMPGNNDILYGIEKVKDYLYSGRVRFFNTLENLRFEAGKYSFPKITESGTKNDKPIDKFNHLMDCLRYVIAYLPENPDNFTNVYTFDNVKKRSNVTTKFKPPNNVPEPDYEEKVYRTSYVRKWK